MLQYDSFQNLTVGGESAAIKLLHTNGDVRVLRPAYNPQRGGLQGNALLRKEEWTMLDREVLRIATKRMSAYNDLKRMGLVKTGGGLGMIISQWETLSDMDAAIVSMSGTAAGRNDRVDFGMNGVPIPLIHKDFSLNLRHLLASRQAAANGGGPANIDTLQAETATRLVSEGIENLIFNGNGMVVNGMTIYGLTTYPSRNVVATSQPWTTPANIYSSIVTCIDQLVQKNFYGPYMVYVSNKQYVQMLEKEGVDVFQTILDRVKKIPGIEDVKPTFALADHNLVVVNLTSDTLDAVEGQGITPVQWNEQGGFIVNYKVMAAFAPRVKSDGEGKCGVVHHTGV
jgi:uncharacterized linocin/CFP29 family protein